MFLLVVRDINPLLTEIMNVAKNLPDLYLNIKKNRVISASLTIAIYNSLANQKPITNLPKQIRLQS